MRKQIFRRADSMLPRAVALIPYQCALVVLRLFIGLGMKASVWNRNSTRSGAFLFGVSDLDLTVVGKSSIHFEFLKSSLIVLKRVFIFLGETNLYHYSQLELVLPRMNVYELKRDPELEKLNRYPKQETKVAKFVFTQRMLFADVLTLGTDPGLRQLKWKNHFDLIGYNHNGKTIDLKFVKEALKDLCDRNPRISESIEIWAEQVFKPGFDPYHAKLGAGFKILAPHSHLWFHLNDSDKEFLKGLSTVEKDIIRAQIDWEFWGLYCQKYNLNRHQIMDHLHRLRKAYAEISTVEDCKKLEQDIALAF